MRHETALVLPVVAISATALLATDLILPALPAMRAELGASLAEVQGTVSAFLVAVALSQLVWGEVVARFGVRRAAWLGMGTVAATALLCALAEGIGTLVAARALQGAAAGVATVVAPTLVRRLLPPERRTAGLSLLATFESLAPAIGPVLGAALLPLLGWRGLFVLLALLALAAPWAARTRLVDFADEPAARGAAGWRALLADAVYRRLALAHATSLGALLGFVTCAPHLIAGPLGRPPAAFATLQVIGVAAFIVAALGGARGLAGARAERAVPVAAAGQAAVMLGLAGVAAAGGLGYALVVAGWALFCALMGLRGPATVAASLALDAAQVPRAAALTMVGTLVIGGLLAQAGAWLLERHGAAAMLAAIAAVLVASLACVAPFPRRLAAAA